MSLFSKHRIFSTFRWRLTLLYIAIECTVLVFAAFVLYLVLSYQIHHSVDKELQQQANILAHELDTSAFPYWPTRLIRYAEHYPGLIQLIASNGQLMFSSQDHHLITNAKVREALERSLRHGKTGFVSSKMLLQQHSQRYFIMPLYRGEQTIAVLVLSRDLNDIHSFFKWLYLIGGLLGLFSMFLSALAGFIIAKRALKPIDTIATTARAVAAGDLSQRLEGFAEDKEIAELIDVLNSMFADLDASFTAQKRFTADASHELRLPLTVMKGEIEVSLRRTRTADEYRQVLQQQLEVIERMHRIVDGLLTLARSDAGILEMEIYPQDISLLVEEAAQHHLGLFASKKVDLELDIEPDMMAEVDEDRMHQVLFNLLNNAFKYAPEGSVIRLHASAIDEQQLRISVCDQGPGISQEDQDHLFDRFYRADQARDRDAGGAGLGLSICKRIIDAHHGSLHVSSELGQGSCFSIELKRYTGSLDGHQ